MNASTPLVRLSLAAAAAALALAGCHRTDATNDKLKSIASSHTETLPTSLPADMQKELDKLSKLSGAAFDKEFIQMVGMKDHKTDIALFEKASKEAKSDDLREFAKSTLPT